VTLTEFLLARIAEDESDVWSFRDSGESGYWTWQRMLAEFQAKRRIVEEHAGGGGPLCEACADGLWNLERTSLPCPTLRLLALPYADHADYREEWRP